MNATDIKYEKDMKTLHKLILRKIEKNDYDSVIKLIDLRKEKREQYQKKPKKG